MNISVPWEALVGGMLVGLSASILMLFSGKVAGISGLVAGVLQRRKNDFAWRLLMLLGICGGVFVVRPLDFHLPQVEGSVWLIAIAGFCVGLGTRLANGCTSGHGIVGLARGAKRSIVATMVFMSAAMVVVFAKGLLGVS